MREAGIDFVVAEQNREKVERLREKGLHAVCGDAAEPATLVQAHVARAAVLVIATPDAFDVRKVVETARALNPPIEVIVRTHSEDEARMLRSEGIGTIFMGEDELAKGMSRHLLTRLGKGTRKEDR
jgi:CPA2 family monovalent cation:H+ antiporter-2